MKTLTQLELPFIRTAWNYDRNAASDESGLKCQDKTLTKQSFLEETDINTIVERFGLTGEMPKDIRAPEYGDFDGIVDYHTAMNAVARANETFDELPAAVRARFVNDPAEFLFFCEDPENREEMKKMGLLKETASADATTRPETHAKEVGKGVVTPKEGEVPQPK